MDTAIIEALNQFARQSPPIDVMISFAVLSHLLKGTVMMLFVWWAWFRATPQAAADRSVLLALLSAALLTVALARGLAALLPMRLRPMHDPELAFTLPIGMPQLLLEGWSSFPSDHAALFTCIAVGLFRISRPAGVIALLYCVLVILLPRIYTGFHYPSDILAGACLGAAVAWLATGRRPVHRLFSPLYAWLARIPGFFYPLLFFVTYQMATLFDGSRALLRFSLGLARELLAS